MVKKIVIPATKKLGKELLKDTSRRLRVRVRYNGEIVAYKFSAIKVN